MRLVLELYRWACQRLYHELAWTYDAVSWVVSGGEWDQWRRLALRYVDGKPVSSQRACGQRVLELGFGTGALLMDLAAAGFETFGLEPSVEMQALAGARLRRMGLRVMASQGMAEAMPFADGVFDVVVATFPAPYILEADTLAECVRVLRPGGVWVTVGLWVVDERWLGRALPVFYGRPQGEVVTRWLVRLAEAGLDARVEEQRIGGARVGVVVGRKGV